MRKEKRAARQELPAGQGREDRGALTTFRRWSLSQVVLNPGDRVLQVDCGAGRELSWLLERVPRGRVCGLDPSGDRVRRARARCRAVPGRRWKVLAGRAEQIPSREGNFDLVIALDAVSRWPDPLAALSEIRRVLRPGGQLVLCESGGGFFPGRPVPETAALQGMLLQAGFLWSGVRTHPRHRDWRVLTAQR